MWVRELRRILSRTWLRLRELVALEDFSLQIAAREGGHLSRIPHRVLQPVQSHQQREPGRHGQRFYSRCNQQRLRRNRIRRFDAPIPVRHKTRLLTLGQPWLPIAALAIGSHLTLQGHLARSIHRDFWSLSLKEDRRYRPRFACHSKVISSHCAKVESSCWKPANWPDETTGALYAPVHQKGRGFP